MTSAPPVTTPRRVLLVSATIGEGHNATARAVEESARRLWPDCEVEWVETLRTMGPGVGPAFRWIYIRNVESTPWLYDLFYAALWRYRWFADASRRFVGAWSGRRLRPVVRDYEPDLVISTYPMGTAGLDWLRRRGELERPVAAVISDFSPHPFWVYPEVDMHYVMSGASLRELHHVQPDAAAEVCVPPVASEFRPADKAESRRVFDLPEDGFLVLVSCGSLGFGSIERAVETALEEPEVRSVVVVCGHNDELRQRLDQRADPRLIPLGWVRDMPTLTAAADVVVTNAGGATALEALACGRTVVMFEPIAGHGWGNAELMARAGLAELCPTRSEFATTLRELTGDRRRLRTIEQRALEHATSGDFTEQVAALARLPRHRGGRALRAQDAFFVHAATERVPQQTGAALLLERNRGDMSAPDMVDHIAELIAERASGLPMLHWRLAEQRGRRPRWIQADGVDPHEHLCLRTTGTEPGHHWHDIVRDFFATAVRTDRPPWELMLVHDVEDDSWSLLAKMHHALGDGLAVTDTLVRLLRDHETRPRTSPSPSSASSRRKWAHHGVGVVRGLASLAGAGTAPASELGGTSTPRRRFGWGELSAAKVRASARSHGIRSSVLLISVMAEALHRLLNERGGTAPQQTLRVMVPLTTRPLHEDGESPQWGNRTVTISVDLPVGPMTPAERMAEVTALMEDTQRRGQPMAAGAVMAALGLLPAPLHAWVVRRVYQRRFFNAIVSVLPGSRRPPRVAGVLVAGVLPVLPLAEGVGLAMGMITWGEMVGVGITADAGLVSDPERLTDHVRSAFDDLQELPARDEGT